jgi:hypothetical protein
MMMSPKKINLGFDGLLGALAQSINLSSRALHPWLHCVGDCGATGEAWVSGAVE